MSIGEPKMPTPEEIAEMNKNRKEYTRELVSGGADIALDETGSGWNLENVSDDQIARARSEMESDMTQKRSSDEEKAEDISKTIKYGLEGLSEDEQRFYESKRSLVKQSMEIERLYQQGKIDDKTRRSLFQPNNQAAKELRGMLRVDDDALVRIENAIRQEVQAAYVKELQNAGTFDELLSALNFGIQGSQEYYTAEDLKDKIGRVRQGRAEADIITSSLGLRQKVEALLANGRESRQGESGEKDSFWGLSSLEARDALSKEIQGGKTRKIRVLRSSGEMDDGWLLTGILPDGTASVMRFSDGKIDLTKEVPFEDLVEWNRW